jgi:hypothetical protein
MLVLQKKTSFGESKWAVKMGSKKNSLHFSCHNFPIHVVRKNLKKIVDIFNSVEQDPVVEN